MRDTRLVELPLQAGVVTNATGYEIGPRLRRCENAAWAPIWRTDAILRRGLMMLPHAASSAVPHRTFAGAALVLGLGFMRGADVGLSGLAAVRAASGELIFYRLSASDQVVLATGVSVFAETARTAPMVYWPGIETPALYMSHPTTLETWRGDEASVAVYTPSIQTPGTQFKGNSALLVHLDRLWMARINSDTAPMDTTIWYSDPFDPETVRATSFVTISDNVRALFRPGASDAGTPHMVIGGDRAIHVLDGDPIFGNAVLRRLSFGIGIADLSLVAETHIGAVILATDRKFYLIPPGGTQMVPLPGIEDQVRNAQALNTASQLMDSLAWSSPYVYYRPAQQTTEHVMYVLDLSGQPRWYGPLTAPTGFTSVATRIQSIGTGADAVLNDLWLSSLDLPTGAIWRVSPEALLRTGRAVVLETGYIQEPDHKVELRNVILETIRSTADIDVTVTASFVPELSPDGAEDTASVTHTLPTTDTPAQDILAKTVFNFARKPVARDYFRLTVTFPAGVEPRLQRVLCEYRVQPRQD